VGTATHPGRLHSWEYGHALAGSDVIMVKLLQTYRAVLSKFRDLCSFSTPTPRRNMWEDDYSHSSKLQPLCNSATLWSAKETSLTHVPLYWSIAPSIG